MFFFFLNLVLDFYSNDVKIHFCFFGGVEVSFSFELFFMERAALSYFFLSVWVTTIFWSSRFFEEGHCFHSSVCFLVRAPQSPTQVPRASSGKRRSDSSPSG